MATYLTRTEVQDRYKTTRSTLYRWINRGIFPAPVKLGPRMVRWKLSDLEQFEQQREEADV